MKAILLLLAFGSSITLFAESSTDVIPYGNLTALGIVAVVLVFIVTKMLPDMYRKYIELGQIYAASIEMATKHFADILDKIHARSDSWEKTHHEDHQAVSAAIRDLASQCARRSVAVEIDGKTGG